MNTDLHAVSDRLTTLEQEYSCMKVHFAVAEGRYHRAERRFRVLCGVAMAAVMVAVLISSVRAADAQGDNGIPARVTALETRMTAVEAVNASQADEIASLNTQLAAEVAARQAADAALQTSVDAEVAARQAADAALQASIGAEGSARQAADATLQFNIDAEVAARKAADLTLQSEIGAEGSARQAADATLQSNVDAEAAARQAADLTLGTQVGALQDKTQFMSVSGSETLFTATNVHILNGLGATDTANGLGNLIIGYNELRGGGDDARSGSHCFVVGRFNNFTSYGGVAFGELNGVTGPFAAVTGGAGNIAEGVLSSITGGRANVASADSASVTGGLGNIADGFAASVSGGLGVTESDFFGWAAGSFHSP